MFDVLDKSIWIDLKLETLEREPHEYSYFSLGGYEVNVRDKGYMQFDFDICSRYTDDKTGIVRFILEDQGDYYDKKMTFEDFKNITGWNEFHYIQDISEGDSEVQERIKVKEFIVCNDEGEKYKFNQTELDMINDCINKMIDNC